MSGPWEWLALFGVGLVAGALNVIAGGGSFLTLPVLIFFGLPATLANGTNRVAILLQNVAAVWGFQRHKVLDWSWALAAAVPATAGAALGALLALRISDEAFKDVLAFLMVAVTLWTLVDSYRDRRKDRGGAEDRGGGQGSTGGEPDPEARGEGGEREVGGRGGRTGRPATSWRAAAPVRRWGLAAGFFAVGIYGGFVQAGVGFLILAATSLAGFDLVRGNAVKVLAILSFTLLSLIIFASQGQVDWATGLVLAVGTVTGSQVGVHLTVLKGHKWVRAVVTVAIVVFAIKLWLD